jgi:hypothetical protein
MTHEIICTEKYLLVVDKNRPTNWYYNETDNRVDSAESTPTVIGGTVVHNIIAHLPINGSPTLEGVDLLPPLEDEAEVMAEEYSKNYYYDNAQDDVYHGFFQGYNKAKEKYKYTEEDIMKAIKMAREFNKLIEEDGYDEFRYTQEHIIQSHQQPKMPIGFNLEAKDTYTKNGILVKTEWVGMYTY